jgi:hypothetical protein
MMLFMLPESSTSSMTFGVTEPAVNNGESEGINAA